MIQKRIYGLMCGLILASPSLVFSDALPSSDGSACKAVFARPLTYNELLKSKEIELADKDLRAIDFSGVYLSKMYLTGAKIRYARGADLSKTNLTDADLKDADVSNADLTGADLTGAIVDGANFKGATYNTRTRFPEGFDPKKAGMKLELIPLGEATINDLQGPLVLPVGGGDSPHFIKLVPNPNAPRNDVGVIKTIAQLEADIKKMLNDMTTPKKIFQPIPFKLTSSDPTVLKRLSQSRVKLTPEKDGSVNLSGQDLRAVDFSNINLPRTSLAGAKLSNARGANLSGSSLMGAELNEADVSNANLREADLYGASLRDADARGTDFTGAKFRHTDLTGAKYDKTTRFPDGFDPKQEGMILVDDVAPSPAKTVATSQAEAIDMAKVLNRPEFQSLESPALRIEAFKKFLLKAKDLRNANLPGINLTNVKLSGRDLSGIKINMGNLTRADLRNVNFTGAELAMTIFNGADLRGAILKGADLRRSADLPYADLRGAKYDKTTRFPDGFDPKQVGMILVDDVAFTS